MTNDPGVKGRNDSDNDSPVFPFYCARLIGLECAGTQGPTPYPLLAWSFWRYAHSYGGGSGGALPFPHLSQQGPFPKCWVLVKPRWLLARTYRSGLWDLVALGSRGRTSQPNPSDPEAHRVIKVLKVIMM